MDRLPVIESAEDLAAAVDIAREDPSVRWYTVKRAAALNLTASIPLEWGQNVTVHDLRTQVDRDLETEAVLTAGLAPAFEGYYSARVSQPALQDHIVKSIQRASQEMSPAGASRFATSIKTGLVAALENGHLDDFEFDTLNRTLLASVRHVRTPEGAKRYGQPIGSVIVPKVYKPIGTAKFGDLKKDDVFETKGKKWKVTYTGGWGGGGPKVVQAYEADNPDSDVETWTATQLKGDVPVFKELDADSAEAKTVGRLDSGKPSTPVADLAPNKTPDTPSEHAGLTDDEIKRKLQALDSQYAALARSQYNFGAGTAKTAPTQDEISAIQAKMKGIGSKMDALRAERKRRSSPADKTPAAPVAPAAKAPAAAKSAPSKGTPSTLNDWYDKLNSEQDSGNSDFQIPDGTKLDLGGGYNIRLEEDPNGEQGWQLYDGNRGVFDTYGDTFISSSEDIGPNPGQFDAEKHFKEIIAKEKAPAPAAGKTAKELAAEGADLKDVRAALRAENPTWGTKQVATVAARMKMGKAGGSAQAAPKAANKQVPLNGGVVNNAAKGADPERFTPKISLADGSTPAKGQAVVGTGGREGKIIETYQSYSAVAWADGSKKVVANKDLSGKA